MKKIIVTLTLILAFSINANAQSQQSISLTPDEKGIKEAKELTQYLSLDKTQITIITSILKQKQNTLAVKELSEERRKNVTKVVDSQIKSALTAEQIEKLQKNTELHNRIIH